MNTSFKVPQIRNGYSYNFRDYGRDVTGFWFEPDHSHEGHREFNSIVTQYLEDYNWSKILTPGTTIVDVGAHSGDTTVIMGAISGATVLAVECNPVIKPWTDFACTVNQHLAKFIVASEAVTTEDDITVTFNDHGNNMCNGGLVGGIDINGGIKIPGITLKTLCYRYLSAEEIAKIDLIKIDTEGHDFLILDSSRDFIDELRPKLFVEWFSAFDDAQSQAMFDIVDSMDYVALYPATFELASPDKRSEDLLLIHKSRL